MTFQLDVALSAAAAYSCVASHRAGATVGLDGGKSVSGGGRPERPQSSEGSAQWCPQRSSADKSGQVLSLFFNSSIACNGTMSGAPIVLSTPPLHSTPPLPSSSPGPGAAEELIGAGPTAPRALSESVIPDPFPPEPSLQSLIQQLHSLAIDVQTTRVTADNAHDRIDHLWAYACGASHGSDEPGADLVTGSQSASDCLPPLLASPNEPLANG